MALLRTILLRTYVKKSTWHSTNSVQAKKNTPSRVQRSSKVRPALRLTARSSFFASAAISLRISAEADSSLMKLVTVSRSTAMSLIGSVAVQQQIPPKSSSKHRDSIKRVMFFIAATNETIKYHENCDGKKSHTYRQTNGRIGECSNTNNVVSEDVSCMPNDSRRQ